MIRKMETGDAGRAGEIHVFGWRSAYREIIADNFLFNKMRVLDRSRYFEDAVRNRTEDNYVYDDGIIKAILTIGPCRDADKTHSFELWGIYVDPFMKRQKIGSKMLEFCEKRAMEEGFSEVCIWVLEKNNNAIAFYSKFGYKPDGQRKYIEKLNLMEVRYCKEIAHRAKG